MSNNFQNEPFKILEEPNLNPSSIQSIINMYSQTPFINNKSNITIDYPRNVSLPPMSTEKKLQNNFCKKIQDPNSRNNNSLQNDINSFLNAGANIMSNKINQNAKMKRDKTQIKLINQSSQDLTRSKCPHLKELPQINQINNITNINIHIYPNKINNNNINTTVNNNLNKNRPINSFLFNSNNNYNLMGNNLNRKKRIGLRGNIKINNSTNKFKILTSADEILNSNNNNSNNKSINFPSLNEKRILIDITNNNNNIANTMNLGNNILNTDSNENNNNFNVNNNLNNIISTTSANNNNNNLQTNNKNNLYNDIDNSVKFLRDISFDSSSFEKFLELFECHIDIELLCLNGLNGNKGLRKKTFTSLSNEFLFKLSKLLNNYFNILESIYYGEDNLFLPNINDSFFLFPILNQLFQKSIKVQMCIYSSVMISMSQLGLYETSSMIKNHFHKIIKEISYSIMNIFDIFMLEEININYSEILQKSTKFNFLERFTTLYNAEYVINKGLKNTELISIISKNIDKSINSMKSYATLNLKYSAIKPYGDALLQLLNSVDKKPLNVFVKIFLNTLLYGELEANKTLIISAQIRENKINNNSPFLPPIAPGYKYTLVLDMDETLIHYFFTHFNGMFFVRPYCFEFLNELKSMYEIITFTAGTRDYADGILNQLDKNGNIIKFRLYRQHTSICGLNVYKDLSKLGRDLSKTIIIDNLRENFKLQPNNGIFIKTWTSDVNDNQFRDIKKILKDIFILNVNDVRPVIYKMNEEIKNSKNILNPYLNIDISKYV